MFRDRLLEWLAEDLLAEVHDLRREVKELRAEVDDLQKEVRETRREFERLAVNFSTLTLQMTFLARGCSRREDKAPPGEAQRAGKCATGKAT